MKVLICSLSLLFASFYCFSQDYIKKYNQYLERYEYYDSSGTLIGYQTYNPYLKQWEYTKASNSQNNTYKYTPTTDIDLINQVLSKKQSRYDYNVQRVQNKIDELHSLLRESGNPELQKEFNRRIREFNSKYRIDYSNNSNTTEVMNYFIRAYNNIVNNSKKASSSSRTSNVYNYKRDYPSTHSVLYTTEFDNPKHKVPLYQYPAENLIYMCPLNSIVKVIDTTTSNKYFKVIVENKVGYVYRNALKLGKINYLLID